MKLKEAWNKAISFVTIKYGLLVGAVIWGIAWLLNTLGIKPFVYQNAWVQFTASGAPLPVVINVREQATAGAIPVLGNWFLDKMVGLAAKVGVPAITLPDMVGILIGGILATGIGIFISALGADKLFNWIKNTNMRKATSIIFYGAAGAGLILGLMTGLDAIGLIVAMGIYALASAGVITLLMAMFKPVEKIVQ
jgi:hypothetical protein